MNIDINFYEIKILLISAEREREKEKESKNKNSKDVQRWFCMCFQKRVIGEEEEEEEWNSDLTEP